MTEPGVRANLPPLALHVPEPRIPPRRRGRFQRCRRCRRRASAPPGHRRARPMRFTTSPSALVRVLDDDRQCRSVPWNPRLSPEMLRLMLRNMALIRAFDERMFRAQRQGKTSFYMKCTGEEAVAVAATMALASRRHVFPQLSPAGHPDRARLSAGRDDEPDLFEQRRQAEGPAAADHVFGEGLRLLLDLRQPRHAISAGRRLGDGESRPRAIRGSPRPGAAKASTAEGDFHSRADLCHASIARR